MKELRKELTNMLQSRTKYSFNDIRPYIEYRTGKKYSEHDIINSFFDILENEITRYNFKYSPKKIDYIFKIFKKLSKHINKFENEGFEQRVIDLEKIVEVKESKKEKLKKDSHYKSVEEFFIRLKNEISLLKMQLKITDEQIKNIETNKDNLENFLEYLIFHIKNYKYIELLYEQNSDLINFKTKDKKYLLDLVLTKYLNSLIENKEIDIFYYERVVNLFLESKNFNISQDYKKALITRLNQFLIELDYSDEKERTKKKTRLFVEETINKINKVEHEYSEEEIKKLNERYKIESRENLSFPTSPFKDNIYEDMTNRPVITIDGDNTESYDDAISFEILPNGNYRVGIYISDVADYIERPSTLDYGASKQGNTIYLPQMIIPLFPSKLANDICSLREKVLRHVIAFTFEFDQDFEMCSNDIKRAIIKVNKNYGNTEVDRILEKKDKIEEYEILKKIILFSEYLEDKNKNVTNYHKLKELSRKVNQTDKLYEETVGHDALAQYMIFINNFVAERFDERKNLPFLYRNNGSNYNEQKLNELKKQVDFNSELEGLMTNIQKIYVPSFYSTTNLGHNGLNLKAYAHTTTPIRNYASLTNQRLIIDFLIEKNEEKIPMWNEILPSIAADLNAAKEREDDYIKEYCKIYRKKKES